MKSFILRDIVGPLVARIGTVIATYLVVEVAANPEAANQIATGISAAALVLVDLIIGKTVRQEGR